MLKLYGRYIAVWLIAVMIYGGFAAWYALPRDILTEQEIKEFLTRATLLYKDANDSERQIRLRGLLAGDDGGELYVVHLVRMRADPQPIKGMLSRPISAFDLFYRWYDQTRWKLYRRASYPLFVMPVISLPLQRWGLTDENHWTHIVLIRHRSRRDMIALLSDTDFSQSYPMLPSAIEGHSGFAGWQLTQFLMLQPMVVMAWIIFALGLLAHLILLIQDRAHRRLQSNR